jgi:hypothetical protein
VQNFYGIAALYTGYRHGYSFASTGLPRGTGDHGIETCPLAAVVVCKYACITRHDQKTKATALSSTKITALLLRRDRKRRWH